jgi:hypothetical protein
MSQDVLYAMAYSKDLHSRGGIKGGLVSLKGADTSQLLTKIIGSGTVQVDKDGLGGSLTITLPDVSAHDCPYLIKKFNRSMRAECQNGNFVLYNI